MSSTAPAPRRAPATQQDVAAAAGVSRGLVSLALKGEGRMSAETRQRILDAASRLSYRTNTAAAELASRRSGRLAVIVPYLDNPFFDVVLRALRRRAADAGFVLAAFVSDLTDRLEQATVDDVLSLRPEGLILPGTSMSGEQLRELARRERLAVVERVAEALGDRVVDRLRVRRRRRHFEQELLVRRYDARNENASTAFSGV